MTLEILQKEMIAAMKLHNKTRKETISSLIGAIKKVAIDEKCKDNITEELVDKVLLKEKKTVQEMIDTCPADREELVRGYRAKMSIIDEFAPTLMTDEAEIIAYVQGTGIELIKANRGAVMKALKGKADMKVANIAVGKLLS